MGDKFTPSREGPAFSADLIDVRRLLGHHLDELLKVDGAIAVGVVLDDHVEDLVLGRVLAHGAQHRQQLLRRYRPAAVLKEAMMRSSI